MCGILYCICQNIPIINLFLPDKYFERHICSFAIIQQSMKSFTLLKDSIIMIGCIVGVGFISGKELISFVGTTQNALLFGIVFCIGLSAFMIFCSQQKVSTLQGITKKIFGKYGVFWEYAICLCLFISLVTVISVAQTSLTQILQIPLPFPLFSLVIIGATFFLAQKNLTMLKWVNFVGLTLAVVALSLTKSNQVQYATIKGVALWKTAIYLFANLTLGLSLTTTVSQQKSPLQCFVASGLSSIAIVLLMIFVLSKCDKNGVCITDQRSWVKIIFCTAIVLCSLSCTVATVLPICHLLQDFLPSRRWQLFATLSSSVVFSLFGFDCILQYGYIFVAIVGMVFVVKIIKYWIDN